MPEYCVRLKQVRPRRLRQGDSAEDPRSGMIASTEQGFGAPVDTIHSSGASQRSKHLSAFVAFRSLRCSSPFAAISRDVPSTTQRHSASASSITSTLGKAPNRLSDRQSPGTIQHLSATRPPSNGNILNSGGPQQAQDQGMSKLCSLAVSLSICAECTRHRQSSLEATKSESSLVYQIFVRPS